MADVMVRVPLTYKQSTLESQFSAHVQDVRISNAVLRLFAKMGIRNPTVEQVIDHFEEIRKTPGMGKKSIKKLVSILTELSITNQTNEQLLENALDFVAMNRGVVE